MTSTSYPETENDWRGRFIANLVKGLANRQDINLSLWAPPGNTPSRVNCIASPKESVWLHELSQNGGIAHLLRQNKPLAAISTAKLLNRLSKAYRRISFDIAHVNWLQNALPLWGTNIPAVVNVLGSDFGLLRLPGMKTMLRHAFKQRKIILAPNAEWMVTELEKIFGDIAMIQAVPFGVGQSWFDLKRQPQDDVHHWLTITRLTQKKVGNLFEWGKELFNEKRVLHLFGPMQEEITLPEWVKYHGPTHPADLQSTWFPQASGLITLSHHDEGRPQVMLEAMASGLPIIASDLPAHKDFILHNETGWLTTSKEDFSNALTLLEKTDNNFIIGSNARAWAKNNIGNWDDCAARYAALYTKLLETQK